MNIFFKIIVSSFVCIAALAQADGINMLQQKTTMIKTERTPLHVLISLGVRLAEVAGGMHMFWQNYPALVDFFLYQETITIRQPGLINNLSNWRVFGKWQLFSCMRCLTLNPIRETHQKSLLPEGVIALLELVPTRLLGAGLTIDGLVGLWKEYKCMREKRERKIVFDQNT